MIGLDTNVLVRLVTRDDRTQYAKVRSLIESSASRRQPFYVNQIVLAETVWVLQRLYRYGKTDLTKFLNQLLANASLLIEGEPEIEAALYLYRNSSADFADCLIVAKNSAAGCDLTATFDDAAGELPAAKLL
jgi:predicted nucleic-acid-binding protein